jgi:hypothetical protein
MAFVMGGGVRRGGGVYHSKKFFGNLTLTLRVNPHRVSNPNPHTVSFILLG